MTDPGKSSEPIPFPKPAAAPAVLRVVPTATEAELVVLAACLQNNAVIDRVQARGLKPEHFSEKRHEMLFEAFAKLYAKGTTVNPVTLKHWLVSKEIFVEVGGFDFLRTLHAMPLPLGAAGDAAGDVVESFQKRKLLGLLEDAATRIYSPDLDTGVEDIIADASEGLHRLEDIAGRQAGPQKVGTFFAKAIETAERAWKSEGLVGVPTGFRDLDEKLGGLHKSDLVIVAGRPSMGKTALATKIAFNAARRLKEQQDEAGAMRRIDGGRVAFFSLEMSAEQLANRMLADHCSIPSDKMRRGELQDADFPTLVAAQQLLEDLPLYIDDEGGMTVAKLRGRCRALIRKFGALHMIVIDYLQLMSGSGAAGGRQEENRVQEISAITRGLKALAKELDVPVVALSQLSRAVEQREDKRPQLSDLRESGSIEQDADVVMFTYREEYYHQRAEPSPRAEEDRSRFEDRLERWRERGREIEGLAEVIIGKQRHGPIGTVMLGFKGVFTRFHDLDRQVQ